jgi:DNA topoisomerase-1
MADEVKFEAYCVKCKVKREIAEPQAVFTAKGQPALEGKCPVCGTRMFRMGRTDLHAGMAPKPVETPPPTGKLVIVESPTKARTVGRFLGKGYTVRASVGHIRDLLRSQLSVDVENDFAPKYRIPNEKRAVVRELSSLAGKMAEIYLATDPDREGEAISWHLSEVLDVPAERMRRVVFHEITQSAVDEAFAHPRQLDMNLVNAQQARRILDRLVGYKLSPLLWDKVRSRLSAGRVQSVAVRLIVEREREIENFAPVEYWTLDAELAPPVSRPREKRVSFKARLSRINGEDVDLKSDEAMQGILAALKPAVFEVSRLKEGQRRRQPAAPYTTSTLQQEASRKLGFTAQRTMRVAQQLYEGLDVGEGQPIGLITYMRTDSTNVAVAAQTEARRFITERYGNDFVPAQPPIYKTRSKGAQEAHEAIRPTSVLRTPEGIKGSLSSEQFRLYDLIWRRFVASQMEPALYDTLGVEIVAGQEPEWPYLFRASGSVLRFAGFLVVYEETRDEDAQEEMVQPLPPLTVGERLDLLRLLPEQHFTQPPPRYTDASLIRTLEEYGIGRPSTYASILANIQQRGYVVREARRYLPTETGTLVNDLLVANFPDIISVDFTAEMESGLDEVAEGEADWVALVRNFYTPFIEAVNQAESSIEKHDQVEYVGRDCPECGAPLIIRWGRYGKFVGCSRFPECRHTEPWLEKTGAICPKCSGELVVKRTRKGRLFYGCARWPECDFTSWKRPLARPCPRCNGLLVEIRKDAAQCLACETQFPLEQVEAEEVQKVESAG